MIINSLEQMEILVKKNKDLRWDGWTVIHSYRSEKARTSRYGAFVDGQWHLQRRFEPTQDGWDIPNRLLNKRG